MIHAMPKKWMHPQTVPRGFLRLYILTLLAKGPETGYSIMQKIEERTDGGWRPGPGTMYPLLKGLATDGLAKAVSEKRGPAHKTYLITQAGERELNEMRANLTGIGRKERVVGRLLSDLLPASTFVPMMITRYKEGMEFFRHKFSEIPQPDRDTYLKELELVSESQAYWARSQLKGKKVGARKRPQK